MKAVSIRRVFAFVTTISGLTGTKVEVGMLLEASDATTTADSLWPNISDGKRCENDALVPAGNQEECQDQAIAQSRTYYAFADFATGLESDNECAVVLANQTEAKESCEVKVNEAAFFIIYQLNATSNTTSATGDPHLSNIRGQKFDVHDGPHHLVNFPRGASDSDALLKIDANATMMPGETSCYNVFFQSARISGKWVGDDILFRHDDDAPMGDKKFQVSMKGKLHDWSQLAKEANIQFSGSEPTKMSTTLRNATSDAPGGEAIQLRIGKEHPVLVQVWASRGSNELTKDNFVQYLNLEVKNLPANAGGLLGLDEYHRPAGAECGLTQGEQMPIGSISDLTRMSMLSRTAGTLHSARLKFRISAQAWQN